MPIPKTRRALVDAVEQSFAKLHAELDDAGPRLGGVCCVDDWSVKSMLAVRAWWSHSVVDWIEEGRTGATPVTPAVGYRWKETPRLNADIARRARRASYRSVRADLHAGYGRVVALIADLDDHELLDVGAFAWAGKYPIRRWISLNTSRQYVTARTYVRRARRELLGSRAGRR